MSTFTSLYQPPRPLSLFFSLLPHSYAIFCCAWRIHLACGHLGSDGYISGGVWWIAISEPQWASYGLMQIFHWGEPGDLGCLPGCSTTMPTPPGHSPGWQAPTQARGVSLPSGCPCLCLSCAVATFSLYFSNCSTTQSAHHSLTARNTLLDLGQTLDSCGL